MQFPWAGSSHMKPGQVSQQEVITLLHLNWLTIRKTYGWHKEMRPWVGSLSCNRVLTVHHQPVKPLGHGLSG